MIGGILIKLAFTACLLSAACFFLYRRKGEEQILRAARLLFHGTVVLLLGASAVFLWLILTHQFQYTYVWSYSSRDLPTPLLVSTFYAGQEGSFMLWAVFTALIGVFLMQYSSRRGYEPEVMGVYGLIQLMLLLMLIVKNPFTYVWESWPGQVQAGFQPADGRGLNPLLRNYWMVIHPQVLFTGFAAMAVPFAYAVAALLKKDYANWIRPATPWVVFGALQLGTGIIMGGFWAYETLGWGGYWGWDPVENSSLVPWLVGVASIHTILSQRKSGAFVRTNLVLAMLCFLLVLYSTFLTRSGVLGDTSVHSFVDPGMWVYWLLVGVMAFFTLLGGILLALRWKEMPRVPVEHSYLSREFALYLGSAALVFVAVFVTIGTSSPIITGIAYGKVTAVDISYYVSTALPLGVAIALLSGLGQLLWWTRSTGRAFFRSLIAPGRAALLLTGALVPFGLSGPLVLAFVAGSLFSLFVNLQVGWRIVKGSPRYAGGALAHVGLAVMFLGFVTSSKYDEKATVSLTLGEPVEVLGYTLTYSGYRPVEGEKFAFDVQVERGSRTATMSPIMYFSAFTNGLIRNPDVANFVSHDLYLAPLSLEQPGGEKGGTSLDLRKGEEGTAGGLVLRFTGFSMPVMHAAADGGTMPPVGVDLDVTMPDGKTQRVTATAEMAEGVWKGAPLALNDRYGIQVVSVRPDVDRPENGRVVIRVQDGATMQGGGGAGKDVLVAEASIKPWINLVWSGVLVLLLGFIVTIVRRAREAAQPAEG